MRSRTSQKTKISYIYNLSWHNEKYFRMITLHDMRTYVSDQTNERTVHRWMKTLNEWMNEHRKQSINQSIRQGSPFFTVPTVADPVHSADRTLFKRIIYNSNHVLHQLLHQPSTTVHNLRPRWRNRTLPDKQTRKFYYKNIRSFHITSSLVAYCQLL